MRNGLSLAWTALGLLLAACSSPYDRAGTWHAAGVNRDNLDNEVVDKVDTIVGHGTPGSDAVLDAIAVTRLHEDKTKPLKNEATTTGNSGAGGS